MWVKITRWGRLAAVMLTYFADKQTDTLFNMANTLNIWHRQLLKTVGHKELGTIYYTY